jgi:ArsR family transcriptional regulator
MNPKTRARLGARANVVKAMAHPTRLFIMDELSRGERCVCELTKMIGASEPTVSRHLAVLRAAGVVDVDKRGARAFYSLRMPCLLNVFECVESVLRSAAEQQMELAR